METNDNINKDFSDKCLQSYYNLLSETGVLDANQIIYI